MAARRGAPQRHRPCERPYRCRRPVTLRVFGSLVISMLVAIVLVELVARVLPEEAGSLRGVDPRVET